MKKAKTKKVAYELIGEGTDVGTPMYLLLAELVAKHHDHLREARIALAWAKSWKPDVDGRLVLGKCKKASDLDRELAAFDFIILLNKGFWLDFEVSDAQRRALLDHELCHAERAYDQLGEPIIDERGRHVYRIRKHDIEEFAAIVERHGCYKRDLEVFADSLRRRGTQDYKPCDECRETPSWVYVTNLAGERRLTRCRCFIVWSERREAHAQLTASA